MRGGRFQLALYSFIDNNILGEATGASADGRLAGELPARNLNPAWGTDQNGPTAMLRSLGNIDFSKFPNGSALDLRLDPECVKTETSRETFAGFLKAFMDLGVMQISMVDTETLLDARKRPEHYPDLMVKVAGYTARFVDLEPIEQDEVIGRNLQSTQPQAV
jgi:formate C-acetyltransferase